HLWIMRWYKTCLLEGKSVALCPEIQHPVGAPLGNFSPLHFQAMLYLPLSTLLHDDIFRYNTVWLFGMLSTGMVTFALAWQMLRDRGCAAFAGMLAMLSGPMIRGRTSAGYSGQANRRFDDLVAYNSPFLLTRLLNPAYPERPDDYLRPARPRPIHELCFD